MSNTGLGQIRVDTIGLGTRALNCLRQAGIKTVADLVACSEDELMALPNFGQTTLLEVRRVLADLDGGLQVHALEVGQQFGENLVVRVLCTRVELPQLDGQVIKRLQGSDDQRPHFIPGQPTVAAAEMWHGNGSHALTGVLVNQGP